MCELLGWSPDVQAIGELPCRDISSLCASSLGYSFLGSFLGIIFIRAERTASEISKGKGEFFTILHSKKHVFVYSSRRVEDKIRLCYCVLKSKSNISDGLLLLEQFNYFTKTLLLLISSFLPFLVSFVLNLFSTFLSHPYLTYGLNTYK